MTFESKKINTILETENKLLIDLDMKVRIIYFDHYMLKIQSSTENEVYNKNFIPKDIQLYLKNKIKKELNNITLIDFDLPFYNNLLNRKITSVPVIRIFGTTHQGLKSLIHVHNYFPYFYIKIDYEQFDIKNILDNNDVDKEREKLIFLSNFAILVEEAYNKHAEYKSGNLNINTDNYSSVLNYKKTNIEERQIIHNVTICYKRDFYGYHSEKELFLKIEVYNPGYVKDLMKIFLSQAIMNRIFQCYEAHISYCMHFFSDCNIVGMDFLNIDKNKFSVRYRKDINDILNKDICYKRSNHNEKSIIPYFVDNLFWNKRDLKDSKYSRLTNKLEFIDDMSFYSRNNIMKYSYYLNNLASNYNHIDNDSLEIDVDFKDISNMHDIKFKKKLDINEETDNLLFLKNKEDNIIKEGDVVDCIDKLKSNIRFSNTLLDLWEDEINYRECYKLRSLEFKKISNQGNYTLNANYTSRIDLEILIHDNLLPLKPISSYNKIDESNSKRTELKFFINKEFLFPYNIDRYKSDRFWKKNSNWSYSSRRRFFNGEIDEAVYGNNDIEDEEESLDNINNIGKKLIKISDRSINNVSRKNIMSKLNNKSISNYFNSNIVHQVSNKDNKKKDFKKKPTGILNYFTSNNPSMLTSIKEKNENYIKQGNKIRNSANKKNRKSKNSRSSQKSIKVKKENRNIPKKRTSNYPIFKAFNSKNESLKKNNNMSEKSLKIVKSNFHLESNMDNININITKNKANSETAMKKNCIMSKNNIKSLCYFNSKIYYSKYYNSNYETSEFEISRNTKLSDIALKSILIDIKNKNTIILRFPNEIKNIDSKKSTISYISENFKTKYRYKHCSLMFINILPLYNINLMYMITTNIHRLFYSSLTDSNMFIKGRFKINMENEQVKSMLNSNPSLIFQFIKRINNPIKNASKKISAFDIKNNNKSSTFDVYVTLNKFNFCPKNYNQTELFSSNVRNRHKNGNIYYTFNNDKALYKYCFKTFQNNNKYSKINKNKLVNNFNDIGKIHLSQKINVNKTQNSYNNLNVSPITEKKRLTLQYEQSLESNNQNDEKSINHSSHLSLMICDVFCDTNSNNNCWSHDTSEIIAIFVLFEDQNAKNYYIQNSIDYKPTKILLTYKDPSKYFNKDKKENHKLSDICSNDSKNDNYSYKNLFNYQSSSNIQIIFIKNEISLMLEYSKIVVNYNPDFIIGYETEKLSIGIITRRAEFLGIKLPDIISRVKSKTIPLTKEFVKLIEEHNKSISNNKSKHKDIKETLNIIDEETYNFTETIKHTYIAIKNNESLMNPFCNKFKSLLIAFNSFYIKNNDIINKMPASLNEIKYLEEKFGLREKIIGRVIINLWRILETEVKTNDYSFENVVFLSIKKKVPKYDNYSLMKYFCSGNIRLISWFVDFYFNKLDLVLELLEFFDIIGREIQFTKSKLYILN